jgi:integrase
MASTFRAADAVAGIYRRRQDRRRPLFRPQAAVHSEALGGRGMTERIMNRRLMAYLERLPGAMHEAELTDGSKMRQCVFSPHSLRATAATLLLDSGVPIEAVQDLLDHKTSSPPLKRFYRAVYHGYQQQPWKLRKQGRRSVAS